MNYQIDHAGASGTWRSAGEVATIRMAVAAARELLADGYDVRIVRAGEVWMTADQITSGNGPYPLPPNWKAA